MIRAARLSRLALALAFLRGLAPAQSTERISVGPGGVEGDISSEHTALSADARFVVFDSYASTLVPGDSNNCSDVFVRDRLAGTLELVSLTSSGQQGDNNSDRPSISDDGRFVAFATRASNLGAGWMSTVVVVRDRLASSTELVTLSTTGQHGTGFDPAISFDGRYVVFMSSWQYYVAGDTNGTFDIFLRDRQLGTTERVSIATGGAQANGLSSAPCVSADGRYVTFESQATNLVTNDTNGRTDIFVRDRMLGSTTRLSVAAGGVEGDGDCQNSSLTPDGHFAGFSSYATNLVANDTNQVLDCFVSDLQGGILELVSTSSTGVQGDSFSAYPALSADGRIVAFGSAATNLVAGDTNAKIDIFVRDRWAGATERASISSAGLESDDSSYAFAVSPDGCCIGFASYATNLVANDTNQQGDIFLRDRGVARPQAYCAGDGSGAACPCGNSGSLGQGCQNSSGTGGAVMSATGTASLTHDTLGLNASGELSSTLSILVQGSALVASTPFGDGLRCTGGSLKRLYAQIAHSGVVSSPPASAESISARSASLGDVIGAGSTRYYQSYYVDSVPSFCPAPQGNSWNVSSGLAVVWSQ